MSLNFRLAHNSGYDYIDLLPNTRLEAIQEVERILKYSVVEIDVPVSTDNVQTIPYSFTAMQAISPFMVDLVGESQDDMASYYTIANVKVETDKVIITRLGKVPVTPIRIKLTFREGGM